MYKKQSTQMALIIVGSILTVLLFFLIKKNLDAPILHYRGEDRVAGCLYVIHPDDNGQLVKDRNACHTSSTETLQNMEAVQRK